ncbi:phage tail sheath C-terminal domain-containing protein [Clostridium botulinum]|uniref:phage tail sheath C-terminal domain-containing protein n=1 Tax=Clostridium botulinum TaxID=1491 RepID=UPI00090A6AB1|nr:phage tail sheath C-terminal domain-containing protein [Clostridium botulinum]APH17568.1 phage tail sheath family protein [Clostridium botulinum]
MGLPEINITFKSLAKSAITRSSRGTVALILKDTGIFNNPIKITDATKIPVGLNDNNKEQIKLALKGGYNSTKEVLVFIVGLEGKVEDSFTSLLNYKWDYLSIPEIENLDKDTVATFIKSIRENKHKKVKVVLPNCKGDNQCIINFTADEIKVGDKTYTTAQYCGRIAGILATTPLNISATYFVLQEVESIKAIEDENKAIDNGELILINDGEKVKIGRAVNSLTTLKDDISEEWKKIKIVDTMDLIYTDIRKTFEDDYIGKVANDLDNKMVFITTVNSYLKSLEQENLLNAGKNYTYLDMETQKLYIGSKGIDIENMKEDEIKEYNTGSKFFLGGKISILDAMEDLDFGMEVE